MTTPLPLDSLRLVLTDEQATARLARRLAGALGPGLIVWLVGGLGAGKTTLVRGMLAALGHEGRVKSPTFTLLEPYELPGFPIYHFDFYRFAQADEWRDAGFDEYFRSRGACLVEWPELAGPALPLPDLRIELQWSGTSQSADDDTGRIARLDAYSEAGLQCLKAAAADS